MSKLKAGNGVDGQLEGVGEEGRRGLTVDRYVGRWKAKATGLTRTERVLGFQSRWKSSRPCSTCRFAVVVVGMHCVGFETWVLSYN
jgi:hypothetical protein